MRCVKTLTYSQTQNTYSERLFCQTRSVRLYVATIHSKRFRSITHKSHSYRAVVATIVSVKVVYLYECLVYWIVATTTVFWFLYFISVYVKYFTIDNCKRLVKIYNFSKSGTESTTHSVLFSKQENNINSIKCYCNSSKNENVYVSEHGISKWIFIEKGILMFQSKKNAHLCLFFF